ncbi:plasmid maintenance protein CcdB [Amaricoccus solimangrovi]|uniref:Toxin CcdB n=1 Tax=Amaricoccus solimangrovi TaxID=2589815 RepID=A0A501WRU6_9RHOB|nr:plasmid maintenance protein CcdB [Amaricoccus solimangrovi]
MRARYDACPAPDGAGFLLDLQSDLLDGFGTRVVAPLLPAACAQAPAKVLNPVFEIEGVPHVLVTQFLAAVPASLPRGPILSLADRADEITRAADMVFHGF